MSECVEGKEICECEKTVLEGFRGNMRVYVTVMGKDMGRRVGNVTQKREAKITEQGHDKGREGMRRGEEWRKGG